MQILHYLIVLVLVGQNPVALKFKDFDTFASESKLKEQMTCEQFIKYKHKNKYTRNYFKIEENDRFEYICLTPEQLQEWLISAQKYNVEKKAQTLNDSDRIVKQDPPKKYKGILRYKEPSSIKSVEAYSSTSYYLEIANSKDNLPLTTSESVSFETMQELINKKVTITAEYIEELPNPNESYPITTMGPNGESKPMTRKFNRVLSINSVK